MTQTPPPAPVRNFAELQAAPAFLVHVNHASLLIKHGEHYCLTDPWLISSAFGAWVQQPSPPKEMVDFILSIDPARLCCVVSHGHDDHLDDFFVKHHLSQAQFVIPRFRSPGLERRLQALAPQVHAVGPDEVHAFGPFSLRFFINGEFTSFDALVAIQTPVATVVHANDNWHAQPPEVIQPLHALRRDPSRKFFYFSQIGIADCFPARYPQHDPSEVRDMVRSRVKLHVKAANANADQLDLTHLQAYANQARVATLDDSLGALPYEVVQALIEENNRQGLCTLKQLEGGDYLDFSQPHPALLNCFAADDGPPQRLFDHCLQRFGQLAQAYVNRDAEDKDKVDLVFATRFDPDGVEAAQRPLIVLCANRLEWVRMLTGQTNLESVTIGGVGLIYKFPKLYNMRAAQIALSNFAYVAQARLRAQGLRVLLDDA
jgi:hypothetical protein